MLPSPETISFDDRYLTIQWSDQKNCTYDLLRLSRERPCVPRSARKRNSPNVQATTDHIDFIRLLRWEPVGHYATDSRCDRWCRVPPRQRAQGHSRRKRNM